MPSRAGNATGSWNRALCMAFDLLKGRVKMPKLSALQGQNRNPMGRVRVTRKLAYVVKDLETAIWLDNSLCPTPPISREAGGS